MMTRREAIILWLCNNNKCKCIFFWSGENIPHILINVLIVPSQKNLHSKTAYWLAVCFHISKKYRKVHTRIKIKCVLLHLCIFWRKHDNCKLRGLTQNAIPSRKKYEFVEWFQFWKTFPWISFRNKCDWLFSLFRKIVVIVDCWLSFNCTRAKNK